MTGHLAGHLDRQPALATTADDVVIAVGHMVWEQLDSPDAEPRGGRVVGVVDRVDAETGEGARTLRVLDFPHGAARISDLAVHKVSPFVAPVINRLIVTTDLRRVLAQLGRKSDREWTGADMTLFEAARQLAAMLS